MYFYPGATIKQKTHLRADESLVKGGLLGVVSIWLVVG
jgi:hypothetical protein